MENYLQLVSFLYFANIYFDQLSIVFIFLILKAHRSQRKAEYYSNNNKFVEAIIHLKKASGILSYFNL